MQNHHLNLLTANWAAPKHIKTLITTRQGGFSQGVYASLNMGLHVGDKAEDVLKNRALVQSVVPYPIAYLQQTHSTTVVQATNSILEPLNADASVDSSGQVACAVMTADCLPVLFCDFAGNVVAAAHAGWRGLANGILQNTIATMQTPANQIMAWLGPAIGATSFEVGQDVYDTFCQRNPNANQAFQALSHQKYLADIYLLARQTLKQAGITQIYGGEHCTVLAKDLFFSYRRDGQTGRMLSAIWIEK